MQAIYTWNVAQGDVNLFSAQEKYSIVLNKRDGSSVPLPIPDFAIEAARVQEYCQQYFPVLKEQNNSWDVEFVLSVVPGALADGQENKSMMSFSSNKLDEKRMLDFSPKAPFYRRVTAGLNIEAECTNAVCDAYQKIVYVPQGMGTFNIAEKRHKVSCPACEQKLQPGNVNNLGFWNTKYKIDGWRSDIEDQVTKEEVAEVERFTTFKTGDDATWEYLTITTEPLVKPQSSKSAPADGSSSGCEIL